jgi:secreted trypsin-like serine protease
MRRAIVSIGVVAVSLVSMHPAGAITFGQLDGDRHPNVGVHIIRELESGDLMQQCSGSLISTRVFLTAAHCLDNSKPRDNWVSFAPEADAEEGVIRGTAFPHPRAYCCGTNDVFDIGVIVLDRAVRGIQPVQLPTAGLLDSMKARLRDQTFTAVGYGTRRETMQGAFANILAPDERRFVTQGFLSLQKAWLTLSMNPRTGSGGTCYGDSGGPHFLGGPKSNLVVSITITGDAVCKATDKTYRLDTPSARQFLDDFVTVPS